MKLLCLSALLAAGCGDPHLVKIKGRITLNGEPIQLQRGERLEVTFFPVAEPGRPPADILPANVDPDGSFRVVGGLKKGVPRGRYQFNIELVDAKGDSPFRSALRAAKKPFECDVSVDDNVNIDLPLAK